MRSLATRSAKCKKHGYGSRSGGYRCVVQTLMAAALQRGESSAVGDGAGNNPADDDDNAADQRRLRQRNDE